VKASSAASNVMGVPCAVAVASSESEVFPDVSAVGADSSLVDVAVDPSVDPEPPVPLLVASSEIVLDEVLLVSVVLHPASVSTTAMASATAIVRRLLVRTGTNIEAPRGHERNHHCRGAVESLLCCEPACALAYGAHMPSDVPVIDLHTHSSCSDGTQSPGEVVASAAAAGVSVMALTDHDVIAGWAPAAAAGLQLGLTVVPGLELSTQAGGVSVHMLAYLVDPDHEELTTLMATIRSHRDTRMQRTVELLATDGFPVDYDAIVGFVGKGVTLGRPHIADALVRAGAFEDRNAAFAEVLHGRSQYYVRHWAPHASDAVQVIRAAGGVPIMAHPFAHARGRTVSVSVIAGLVDAGMAGLEVHHRDHDADAMQQAGALCRDWGLIATGSSDYHGAGKSNRLAEHTTDPAQLDRILEMGTGNALMGARR